MDGRQHALRDNSHTATAAENSNSENACLKFLKETGASLGREAQLAGETVGAIPGAFVDAFRKHPKETLAKVVGAAATSFALGYLSKRTGLLAFAARAAGPALGISFAVDVLGRTGEIGTAMGNAWRSDSDWQKNVDLMRGSVSTFVVDTTLCSAFGAGGAKLGRVVASRQEARAAVAIEKQIASALAGIKLKPNSDIELPIFSQKLGHRAVVHTGPDFDPKKPHDVLITLDSFTAQKTEPDMFGKLSSKTGMSKTNGLDETANRHNFVNLHLYSRPETILPGVRVSSWQSPGAGVLKEGGFLMGRRPLYDDAVYAKDAVLALASKMQIRSLNLAAFAEGAEFAPNVLHTLAREPQLKIPLKSATLVAGTTFGTELPPPPLQDVVLVRGTVDPNFPEQGGAGRNSRPLSWLGHKKINDSQPLKLEQIYRKALGIEAPLEKVSSLERTAASPDGKRLTAITLDGVGCTWPGRHYGLAHESVLSPVNGPQSDFNVNERIAQLIARTPVARDLAPLGEHGATRN